MTRSNATLAGVRPITPTLWPARSAISLIFAAGFLRELLPASPEGDHSTTKFLRNVATVCASANEQVVHGIPSNRPLVEGDILSIDMGARLDGFFGDCAVTVPIGTVSPQASELLRVTEEALFHGIEAVKPGARVSDIGAAIQQHVEAHGFSVVREFVGHGIGTALHEEPQIANYGPGGRGPRLAEGMVLAIEPMVNAGKPAVKVLSDGWTAVTRDGSLSAHFEHAVVVSAEGREILTLLPADAARAAGRALSGAPTEA